MHFLFFTAGQTWTLTVCLIKAWTCACSASVIQNHIQFTVTVLAQNSEPLEKRSGRNLSLTSGMAVARHSFRWRFSCRTMLALRYRFKELPISQRFQVGDTIPVQTQP
jgi:hypothetical protein